MEKRTIVLGSTSPRRKELLKPFYRLKIKPANCDERVKRNESPRAYVKRIALEKWKAVAAKSKSEKPSVIVTADTTVVFKNEIIGKPRNRADAKKILQKHSGKSHKVLTAVCVGRSDKKIPRFKIVISSSVKFRNLTEKMIENYLDTNEWKDKAGAYGIQGRASKFVEKISGSLTNIVGLPLKETKSLIVQTFSQALKNS